MFSQALVHEDLLLLLEDVLDIELRQFFVCVVDKKLLESVGLEHLKSVDVQQTDAQQLVPVFELFQVVGHYYFVQLLNQPLKEGLVKELA